MPRTPTPLDRVYYLAEPQHGYFTTRQAREVGVDARAIVMMARRGTVERVRRGVYRIARFPESPLGQYMEAVLWPHGIRAVVSHESALVLHDLSDVNPASVHITVPRMFRIRRRIPSVLTVHHADLEPGDQEVIDGIPVTTPYRTIDDCARAHLSPALLRQAVRDGGRLGRLTALQAARLDAALQRVPAGEW